MSLLVNNNPQVLWHETIIEAEDRCDVTLEKNLEVYLASLLARYTDKPALVKRLFAQAFMQTVSKSEAKRHIFLPQIRY